MHTPREVAGEKILEEEKQREQEQENKQTFTM
jgi:hypothetical protein